MKKRNSEDLINELSNISVRKLGPMNHPSFVQDPTLPRKTKAISKTKKGLSFNYHVPRSKTRRKIPQECLNSEIYLSSLKKFNNQKRTRNINRADCKTVNKLNEEKISIGSLNNSQHFKTKIGVDTKWNEKKHYFNTPKLSSEHLNIKKKTKYSIYRTCDLRSKEEKKINK